MIGWLIAGGLLAWFAVATGTGIAIGTAIRIADNALHTDLEPADQP